MNLHVQSGDVSSRGNAVTGIGEQIEEGVHRGRSLELTVPGLEAAAAFSAFRDTWLGEGQKVSLDLSETGEDVVRSDKAHSANEDAIERGYDAITR